MIEKMYFEKGKKYDADKMANVVAMVTRRCSDEGSDLEPIPLEDFVVIVKSVRRKKVSE